MDIPENSPPPHHTNDSATAFQNPWEAKSLLASRQLFSQFPLALANRIEEQRLHVKQVTVVKPDFGSSTSDVGVIKVTWLGHAVCSMYIGIFQSNDTYCILSPIYSYRDFLCNCRRLAHWSPFESYSILSGQTVRHPTNTQVLNADYLHRASLKTYQTFNSLSLVTISESRCYLTHVTEIRVHLQL